jgi:type IV secretion system protein VirB3
MAGAPRSAAILIGTLAAVLALGLRLWIPGLLFWVIAHSAAVFAAKTDPDFMTVAIRSLKHKAYLKC